jgi:hypothetical protein
MQIEQRLAAAALVQLNLDLAELHRLASKSGLATNVIHASKSHIAMAGAGRRAKPSS